MFEKKNRGDNFLKLSKKVIQKVMVLTMVVCLLNPIVGSLSVFASGNTSIDSSKVIEESQNTEMKDSSNVSTESGQTNSSEKIHNPEDASEETEQSVEENKTVPGTESDLKPEIEESQEVEEIQENTDKTQDETIEQEIDEEIFSIEETREKAMQMMDDEKNTVSTFSMKSRAVSKTDAFINAVSSYAVTTANEQKLYPSVMIAQAALESAWGTSILAYKPNYNLFGIKGEYNGQSFSKYTKEYNEKTGWSTIKANFKKYPSYKETFLDNANKLRNGTEWNATYYNGTWKENTKTYKDATNWLTGRYATDPTYGEKLNQIIATYDLTRFDTVQKNPNENNLDEIGNLSYDEVTSTTDIKDYEAYINGETDGIYTTPKGTDDSSVVASSAEYFDKKVMAIKESKTKNGLTWILIQISGKNIGWIEKNGLSTFDTISSTKNTNYKAIVKRLGDTLDTAPWGTKGFQTIGKTDTYIGKEVTVLKESVTIKATWALIKLPNNSQVWVNKAALDVEKITSSKETNYKALISRKGDTLNTAPWGTEGFKTVTKSDAYVGQEFTVLKEAITRRATCALIKLPGNKEVWIDKKALNIEKIDSIKSVNYKGTIKRKGDTINTAPWGTEGYKTVAKSDTYVGKEVTVLEEAKTRRAEWALISINGKELGWIDMDGLDTFDTIDSTKTVNYKAIISRSGDTLDTAPWGTKGFQTIGKSKDYLNKEVTVIKEAVTYRATWALVKLPGGKQAWIDKKALNIEKIESSKTTNYKALISRSGDSLNSAPWGTEGYQTVGSSDSYVGKEVTVLKEAITRRATWSLVKLPNNKQVWIDKKALNIEKIESSKVVDYKALISRKGDTLNTAPWGTEGYQTVGKSDDYVGKEVTVLKEAITRRATWALVRLPGGKEQWIDKKGLNIEKIISNVDVSDYKARIVRTGDSINTLPWGTEGYKKVTMSDNYFGAEVTVLRESTTRRATWLLIAYNGKQLGWIDKASVKKITTSKKVVVLDPGHGDGDPGATSGGVQEKALNLFVSLKVKSRLEAKGYEVIMTRKDDTFLELSERATLANQSKADIFVSIHANAFNGTAHGIETYSYNRKGNAKNPLVANNSDRNLRSGALALSVQNALVNKTGAFNRGAKTANFHVVRETGMPAILVEMGFVDHTSERAKLRTNAYQDKLADGITTGIVNYFNKY